MKTVIPPGFSPQQASLWREARSCYNIKFQPGDRFLDIGACQGFIAERALELGADNVISVEPDAHNCEAYRARLEGKRALLIEAAAVPDAHVGETVTLYESQNPGRHSLLIGQHTRPSHKVPVVRWSALLALEPNVVKVDIEGGEYALDFWQLHKDVRLVVIEFHGRMVPKYVALMERTIAQLESIGFKKTKWHDTTWAQALGLGWFTREVG